MERDKRRRRMEKDESPCFSGGWRESKEDFVVLPRRARRRTEEDFVNF